MPASVVPGFRVLIKLLELGNAYSEALLPLSDPDESDLPPQETDKVMELCLNAFVDYLIIYFDRETQNSMHLAWEDLSAVDQSLKSIP
jgi:hypothetical protein